MKWKYFYDHCYDWEEDRALKSVEALTDFGPAEELLEYADDNTACILIDAVLSEPGNLTWEVFFKIEEITWGTPLAHLVTRFLEKGFSFTPEQLEEVGIDLGGMYLEGVVVDTRNGYCRIRVAETSETFWVPEDKLKIIFRKQKTHDSERKSVKDRLLTTAAFLRQIIESRSGRQEPITIFIFAELFDILPTVMIVFVKNHGIYPLMRSVSVYCVVGQKRKRPHIFRPMSSVFRKKEPYTTLGIELFRTAFTFYFKLFR